MLVVCRSDSAGQSFLKKCRKSTTSGNCSVSGSNKDQITLSNFLFGIRAIVHNMTKEGDILETLQKVGFKRVTFSNGFGKSQYYDLQPDREDNAGDKVLADMGLAEPFKL